MAAFGSKSMMSLRALADIQASIASVRRTLASEGAIAEAEQNQAFDSFLSDLEQQTETFAHAYLPIIDLEERDPKGSTSSVKRPIVAIVAINNFSALRNEYGQAAARHLIDKIIDRLRSRLGNIECGRTNQGFIELIFDGISCDVEATLKDVHQSAIASIQIGSQSRRLDLTIGYTDFIGGHDTINSAFDRAEHALTRGRTLCLDVANYTSEESKELEQRKDLSRALRGAIVDQEMSVYYMPKLDLKEGKIISAEALVRWDCPNQGQLLPDEFIGLAESLGVIRPITRFVISSAIAAWEKLKSNGIEILINVNLSSVMVSDFSFILWLMDILKGKTNCLTFEINESSVISKPTQALRNLNILAECGIRISIDDYGKGLSSLNYLKLIPANEIKIDKSFGVNLTKSHVDPILLRSTIDLAHGLGMTVTAQGVENSSALALLRIMGCDNAQGNHISQPLSFEKLIDYLKNFELDKSNRSVSNLSFELSPSWQQNLG